MTDSPSPPARKKRFSMLREFAAADWLTLANGQRGMANISETHFNSRTPEATLIQFMGKGPLA